MTNSTLVLALAFGIGVIAGLRAMTAPAVASWLIHLRGSSLPGSPFGNHLSFMGSTITVAIFTIAAIGELVNDKLPKTGSRTAPPSLVVRAVMGALAPLAKPSSSNSSRSSRAAKEQPSGPAARSSESVSRNE